MYTICTVIETVTGFTQSSVILHKIYGDIGENCDITCSQNQVKIPQGFKMISKIVKVKKDEDLCIMTIN